MISQYTPGPWTVYALAVETEHFQIAYCGNTVAMPIEEKQANARLIATAPELLEALVYVRRFVKGDDVDVAYLDDVIAKARGIH